jgi:hypothetical protein
MIGPARPSTRFRRAALLGLAGLIGAGVVAAPRQAAATRFALLVGNNEGQNADAHLRFAESDTLRLAELLTRLGGFSTGGTVVLLARTATQLRQSLAEIDARLRSTPGDHLVLVFYSGHADGQALHLGSSSFPLMELRESVTALPAATRVLILDACQAGVLTRPKGGRSGPGFDIDLGGKGEAPRGLAVLASSTGSELAQESDQLGASVFTHYLRIGLAGLADRNRDGNVSLGEVFDYAADRTLAATLGTTTGPQHPTFRVDLAGRDDLILTHPGSPGAGYGQLRLDVPGWYFVRREDGTIAAEVLSNGSDTLALEAGPYQVTRRERNNLDVAAVSVADGGATAISRTPSHAVAFGRMVRKGEGPRAAYGLAVATAVRTPLEDLGASLGGSLAARTDLSVASFELRLGVGRAHQGTPHLSSTTWDLSAAGAVLRMHDAATPWTRASNLSWGLGLQAGVSYMTQLLDDGERHEAWSPFAGPVALAELTLSRRLFLRATLDASLYALHVQSGGTGAIAWRPAIGSSLGGGTSF